MLKKIIKSISPGSLQKKLSKQNTGNPFDRNIDEGVDFALYCAKIIVDWLPGGRSFLKGKWFLEVGPGQDFGMPLLLMGCGARILLVDRFLSRWTNKYHPEFYRKLRLRAEKEFPDVDLAPLDKVIKSNSHDIEDLVALRTGLENLTFIRSNLVDISYSNATFEHLSDAPAAIGELGRITRPGGIGFHQIDLRDHRSFDTPLEHLVLTESEFIKLNNEQCCAVGTSMRSTDFHACFEKAGFVTKFEGNSFVESEEYLDDVRPRLDTRFSSLPDEVLRTIGGRFHITKL